MSDEAYLDRLAEVYVTPFFQLLLHGNLVREPAAERAAAVAELRRLAPTVTWEMARAWWESRLEGTPSWRESMTASWWAAVHRWPGTADELRPRLLASETIYAGQMHCLALARLATPAAVEALTAYLDVYGPRRDLDYDQRWAVASLRIAAPEAGEAYAARYPWFADAGVDADARAMAAVAAEVAPAP